MFRFKRVTFISVFIFPVFRYERRFSMKPWLWLVSILCTSSVIIFFFRFFFVVKMCLVSQKTVWEKKIFAFEYENENPCETLKCLRARIFFCFCCFFFFKFYGKGWVEFGYIVFGLNGIQWFFG